MCTYMGLREEVLHYVLVVDLLPESDSLLVRLQTLELLDLFVELDLGHWFLVVVEAVILEDEESQPLVEYLLKGQIPVFLHVLHHHTADAK